MFKKLFALSPLILTSSSAWAIVAMFPPELKDKAVIAVPLEKKFLENETEEQNDRPVWLHGGDSISTGWASGTSLRERLALAEHRELPEASSLFDHMGHFPSHDFSWYAGRKLDFGFYGSLNEHTDREWVMISTARVGTQLSGQRIDPLEAMTQIESLERVELVTFSLGGNDLCGNTDPAKDQVAFENRLKDFKAALPEKAKVLVFDVPDVVKIRESILARLNELPDSVGKERMIRYCRQNWQNHCEAASEQDPEKMSQMRESIRNSYYNVFENVVAIEDITENMDPLDMMAGDCFHPSRLVQDEIKKKLEAELGFR